MVAVFVLIAALVVGAVVLEVFVLVVGAVVLEVFERWQQHSNDE